MHRVSGTLPGLAKVEARVDSDAWVPLPVSDPPGSSAKPFAGWVGSDDGTGPDGTGPIGTGSATITIEAKDYATSPAEDTHNVAMTVVNGANKTFTYDDNGNTTSITDNAASRTTAFTWDAADQLRRIEYYDGTATEFEYDAMGRRVRILEYDDTPALVDSKYFLWDGLSIAEERDGGTPATVTAQYFAQGEIRGGTKYFYGRDHLGSVRDVVDESTGNIVARFDYDPYGRREQTVGAGTFDVDWGFKGHYFHELSGLHLALFLTYALER